MYTLYLILVSSTVQVVYWKKKRCILCTVVYLSPINSNYFLVAQVAYIYLLYDMVSILVRVMTSLWCVLILTLLFLVRI